MSAGDTPSPEAFADASSAAAGALAAHRAVCCARPASRFGVIYAGLFAVSAVALALFLWWATAGLLDRQTEAAINADAQGLRNATHGGLPALMRRSRTG